MVASDPFWSLHTHSVHSVNDAMAPVKRIVDRSVELGYPAIGLTDHRSVAGAVQLYTAARKAGIEPLPGIELDVFPDRDTSGRKGKMHLTVAAYNEAGYRNLMRMATLTARNFWYSARIDFADLAAMHADGHTEGLVVSTGCFFGVVPQVMLHQGTAAAVHVAQALAGWFPMCFVELQNHGVEQQREEYGDINDDDVLDGVWEVANKAGLPVIIGRDSHYVDAEDQRVHDALKRLVSFSEDPDEAVFPGDGYYMTDRAGLRPYYPPRMLEAGISGLTDLAEAAYVRIPELETFRLNVPDVGLDDPMGVLIERVDAKLAEWGLADNPIYTKQKHEEYDTIRTAEIAPYMLLVAQVCDFMREKGIRYGARGSACGSLVTWALEISERPVDPVALGLKFSRFLSKNRMKPPDIDLDIEHRRRAEVIAYLNSRWAVRSIGNQSKYSIYAADDNIEGGDHSRGSLRERFFTVRRKLGEPDVDWRYIPKEQKDMLFELSRRKLISGYGRHAAGQIVAPNEHVLESLPLVYIASSKTFVTAFNKKDVELLGLLKLDALGLRTRTAIANFERMVGFSINDIEPGDKATYRMIGNGRTHGVFQLDGATMQRGCREIRPKELEDLIVMQALYRPAPLNAGMKADYMARKRGREVVPQRHPDIMEATANTYGVLAYQEQVMEVLELLGLSREELEVMLDAVKASNEYTNGAREAIAGMLPTIEALAHERGWSGVDIEWLLDGLDSYADYSFNRAHAAAYGDLAYRHAWAKCHYKLEFWTSMLDAYIDDKKSVAFMSAARRFDDVRFYPPHVNLSQVSFTHDKERGGIRRGLMTVKGIGASYATRIVSAAPFTSYEDLGERTGVPGSKQLALGKPPAESGGAIFALYEGNALEGLTHRAG